MGHFLMLCLHYLLALCFVALGVLCMIIPWSDTLQSLILQVVQQNDIAVFLFGIASLAIGCAFFTQLTRRRRYYTIRTGANVVSIDKDLITAYLHEYFYSQYPASEVPCQVTIKNNHLQITADLPATPRPEQKGILKKLEQDVQELLASRLGYHQSFRLYVSFAE